MALFTRRSFVAHIGKLKGTSISEQWESHVAKVGGKAFALLAADGSRIVFKVTELSFDGLTSLEDVDQAAYFAKRQWVAVGRDAVGLTVGIPKRQSGRPAGPKDELDKLMDQLDDLDL